MPTPVTNSAVRSSISGHLKKTTGNIENALLYEAVRDKMIETGMKKQLIFGSFLTLFCGGLIYVLFRTETLTMFDWYKTIGLENQTNELRRLTIPFAEELPEWMLFSLPDGLWLFSYVCLLLAIWQNTVSAMNAIWMLLIPMLAIASEIGQLFGLVDGTFDVIDLLFYLLGMALPFILFTKTTNLKFQLK